MEKVGGDRDSVTGKRLAVRDKCLNSGDALLLNVIVSLGRKGRHKKKGSD